MNPRSGSKTSLFLMEIVIVILVFAVSAAIFLRIFTAARLMTEYSTNLSNAAAEAQTAAEVYKAYGLSDRTAEFLSATAYKGVLTVNYDADWQRTTEENSVFTLTLYLNAGGAAVVKVAEDDGDEVLFRIETRRPAQMGGTGNE